MTTHPSEIPRAGHVRIDLGSGPDAIWVSFVNDHNTAFLVHLSCIVYVCTRPVHLLSSPFQTALGLPFSHRDGLLSPKARSGLIPQHHIRHFEDKDDRIVVVAVEGVSPLVLHLGPDVTDVTGREVLAMVFRYVQMNAPTGVDNVDQFSARTILVHNAIEGDVLSGAIISLEDLVVFDEDGVAVLTTCLLDEVPPL